MGYRVDYQHLNFVLIKNFISIGTSYLSLVINEKLQKEAIDCQPFDLEAFSIINHQNTLLHYCALDDRSIEYILENY